MLQSTVPPAAQVEKAAAWFIRVMRCDNLAHKYRVIARANIADHSAFQVGQAFCDERRPDFSGRQGSEPCFLELVNIAAGVGAAVNAGLLHVLSRKGKHEFGHAFQQFVRVARETY